ncbi:hypothetical protein L596_003336 [Steinernema carpocapsae]|uniref:Uncharacterized protein n=1 Tax=Steinernema carpocapsae TaxID=34508 RepID=A0A4U8UW80_STECR|nr:hypothetical protein L596_003336 [Steinernema carpocapsae]
MGTWMLTLLFLAWASSASGWTYVQDDFVPSNYPVLPENSNFYDPYNPSPNEFQPEIVYHAGPNEHVVTRAKPKAPVRETAAPSPSTLAPLVTDVQSTTAPVQKLTTLHEESQTATTLSPYMFESPSAEPPFSSSTDGQWKAL